MPSALNDEDFHIRRQRAFASTLTLSPEPKAESRELVLYRPKYFALRSVKAVPLLRQIIQREDRRHRTHRHTSAAVNALHRVDVEHLFFGVRRRVFLRDECNPPGKRPRRRCPWFRCTVLRSRMSWCLVSLVCRTLLRLHILARMRASHPVLASFRPAFNLSPQRTRTTTLPPVPASLGSYSTIYPATALAATVNGLARYICPGPLRPGKFGSAR